MPLVRLSVPISLQICLRDNFPLQMLIIRDGKPLIHRDKKDRHNLNRQTLIRIRVNPLKISQIDEKVIKFLESGTLEASNSNANTQTVKDKDGEKTEANAGSSNYVQGPGGQQMGSEYTFTSQKSRKNAI